MLVHYILFRYAQKLFRAAMILYRTAVVRSGATAFMHLFIYLLNKELWKPGNADMALDVFLFKVTAILCSCLLHLSHMLWSTYIIRRAVLFSPP